MENCSDELVKLNVVNVALEHIFEGSDGFLKALTSDAKKLRRFRKPPILNKWKTKYNFA